MSTQPQRWTSRHSHSPPNPSNLSSQSHSADEHDRTSGSSDSSSNTNNPGQYIEYNPPQNTNVRSPGTPFHSVPEDLTMRLLASQSAPSSPVPGDSNAPLPGAGSAGGRAPSRNPSAGTTGASGTGYTGSPLNPNAGGGGGSGASTISNPFSSRAGSINNGPSRPASRGSMMNPNFSTAFPTSNPPHSSSPNFNRHMSHSNPSANNTAAEDGVIATLGLGAHNSGFPSSMGQRGSMVLYRLADDIRSGPSSRSSPNNAQNQGPTLSSVATSHNPSDPLLLPPKLFSNPSSAGSGGNNRHSFASSSGDSIMSLGDSPYPSSSSAAGTMSSVRGLIPYAYDPAMDENEPFDEEDLLHDPNPRAYLNERYRSTRRGALAASSTPSSKLSKNSSPGVVQLNEKPSGRPGATKDPRAMPAPSWEKKHFPWRGILNVGVLILLLLGLMCLFVFYPVLTFFRDQAKNQAIQGNIRINGTGQAPVLIQVPEAIDKDTPESARSRTGFDGQEYELVFSDEFELDGRSFYAGDDPFWEAVDLWYGATGDLEWYDPAQVTTKNGALVITMDSTNTTQAGMTSGSTAPFTADENHQLGFRSGMLQTWNKFCFTTGYIEVSVTFPGPDENTQGYWPGAWTMGNLARPGYPATTDGMWPYTYDSCDVGTFPNQTFKDGSGPPAALHSDMSRSKYNFELSWLSGQRLSACSCPGSDHPGPTVSRGRGAPEIDIFEAEKDKDFVEGQVVSQSAQFAPFAHDYVYSNDTGGWENLNPATTRANSYRGSAVQQAVSAVVRTPSDMFQGSGANFRTFGFEYWSDPNSRGDGYVTWMVDGQQTHKMGAGTVGPDPLENGGSGVGARLIPEEPMAIILNLGISPNWQTIDFTTMQFPAEMKVDYVRVYQRKGQSNVGCNPKNYPTTDYINSHLQAYTDINMTTWAWEKPKNSMYDGC